MNVIKVGYDFLRKGEYLEFQRFVRHGIYCFFNCSTKGNKDYEKPSLKLDTTHLKIAVYTCVVGHYDDLVEPLFVDPGVDYYAFTDMECSKDSVWKKVDVTQFEEYRQLSPAQMNRRIKMLSFRYLPGYDYTVYVDGNVEIQSTLIPEVEKMGECPLGIHYHRTRDCIYDESVRVLYLRKANEEMVKQQMAAYKEEGLPRRYGLYENTVLIKNNHDEGLQQLMELWWEEYQKYPTRDQLSLAYVIWKAQYDRSTIHIIGNNIDKSAVFKRVRQHRGKE
jgi:hypothetical protein